MSRPVSPRLSRRRVIVAGGAAAVAAPLVARPAAAAAPLAGTLVVLAQPVRVFDSREASSVLGGAKFTVGDAVAVTVSQAYDPALASAVFANVTVTDTEGAGYLTVWAGDASGLVDPPETSNVNWAADGLTLANLSLSQIGQENSIEVRCGGAGSAHVIVDIQGYVPFEIT
jgi:hypothetical protein